MRTLPTDCNCSVCDLVTLMLYEYDKGKATEGVKANLDTACTEMYKKPFNDATDEEQFKVAHHCIATSLKELDEDDSKEHLN